MSKFSQRSYASELLDEPNIPQQLLFQNLRELDVVNRLLGGHNTTISGIKKLVTDKAKTYHIVDIGCGGGDAMKYIANWARKNGFKVKLTGVDMKQDCIDFMKEACSEFSEITGVAMDYRDYCKQENNIDVVHCSLFCHHLNDEELAELFQYMNTYSKVGFVINDLHRNWVAYYSIKLLTRLLNGSSLVKNDAPLSVLRGFRKSELINVVEKSGCKKYNVKWKWAFRYLVVGACSL